MTFTFYMALSMSHNHPLFFSFFFANKMELLDALWDALKINLLSKNTRHNYKELCTETIVSKLFSW